MPREQVRVGLIGAGYIAPWHASALKRIPHAKVVAVCDTALEPARQLADSIGAAPYSTVDSMLSEGRCDVVHILSPPHLHKDHALKALAAGSHVFVEKPFALSGNDCESVVAAASAAGRHVAVNHNFMGLGSYVRLKQFIADGLIGRIDSLELAWRYPLALLRSGPFGSWMLRAPENLLLELGPHLFAFAVDLCGPLHSMQVRAENPIEIPGGITHFQGWRITGIASGVAVSISISLVEGIDDRSLAIRGVCGSAKLDFANDTLVLRRTSTADIILNPLAGELNQAWQHTKEGLRNAWRQTRSLNRDSPYGLSFQHTIRSFYDSLVSGLPVDARFTGASAAAVMRNIEVAIGGFRTLHPQPPRRETLAPVPLDRPCTVLVTGGTGFIGRVLVHALVAAGLRVRVLSRGTFNPFPELGSNVDLSSASPKDQVAMRAALEGVECVYHLAKATESTWEGYLENDVGVAEVVARAALEAGVRRFIYCGTIASYDASRADRPVTEQTAFGNMSRRNLYARSKAMCESRLLGLRAEKGLPLIIARPGIVIGKGGPLQHWGIGRWHGAGAVKIWGAGNNVLPFVLVEDVADALIKMHSTPHLEGESFNLIGEPMLTARDYFCALHEQTGTRIRVSSGNLTLFYLFDLLKFAIKRSLLGRRTVAMPTLDDWRSRAHLSPFPNGHAKKLLGWSPETDKVRLVTRSVGGTHLFGY